MQATWVKALSVHLHRLPLGCALAREGLCTSSPSAAHTFRLFGGHCLEERRRALVRLACGPWLFRRHRGKRVGPVTAGSARVLPCWPLGLDIQLSSLQRSWEKTPRCLVTPLPGELVGPAPGMVPGLDKQPELEGVLGVTGGHGRLFVLGCQAGARP